MGYHTLPYFLSLSHTRKFTQQVAGVADIDIVAPGAKFHCQQMLRRRSAHFDTWR
jgi:hypothetical protein